MNKEQRLNLNAGDYAISHCESDGTYNGIEVHKMLCDAYIAGSNDTFDDEAYRKAYYDGYNKCNRDWIFSQEEQKASYTTIVETGDGGINALVTRELPTDELYEASELHSSSYGRDEIVESPYASVKYAFESGAEWMEEKLLERGFLQEKGKRRNKGFNKCQ